MKFKVGDRVRLLNYKGLRRPYGDELLGKEGIITVIDELGCEIMIGKRDIYIKESNLELAEPPINEIISLDYRVEYHNKVEECELLQAKYDYLWHTILKEK